MEKQAKDRPSRTAVATATRMRRSEEKLAAKLRARGWQCVSPYEPREGHKHE